MLRHRRGKVSILTMPGSPWTSWIGLGALLIITVLIGFDTLAKPDGGEFLLGLWTLCTIPVLALILWFGWQFVKDNGPKNELFS